MKKNQYLIYIGIIAVCFLYTGSAFMSQSFRLMEYYPEKIVDIITSIFNYLFQAIGISLFLLGLRYHPNKISNRKLFICLLVSGAFFMSLSQLSNNGLFIQLMGYIFNLHIGIYFGYYLAMFAQNINPEKSGLCFGVAYAIASVGTYIISIFKDGAFLVSKEVTAIYLIMASITIALVYLANNLDVKEDHLASKVDNNQQLYIKEYASIIALMTVIFTVGAGLYYSLPVATLVNWNLIRAFYAVGLILAGLIMDKNRLMGEVLAIASLTYPLIMTTIVGDGVTNTVALSISYCVRGFVTIYYILVFTDMAWDNPRNLVLAPVGLMVSRIIEIIVSSILMFLMPNEIVQLLVAAVCFVPLLILFVIVQNKKYVPELISEDKKLALYAERHALTSREIDILKCLINGMSDAEIADQLFISKNTVRFHISNLMKKTDNKTRVEVVQAFHKS